MAREEGVGEQNRRETEDEDWGAARRGAIEARRRRQFELAIDLFLLAMGEGLVRGRLVLLPTVAGACACVRVRRGLELSWAADA